MENICDLNNHPKVFISYSHDSESHKAWVKKLATDLRKNGVDVILDQFHLRIGQDLRSFMEERLNEAEIVLCICSSNYVKKSNNGNGGTGYESMIISTSLLKNVKTDYIIPIVRNNKSENKVPTCLGTKLYIDFSNDDEYYDKYMELLKRIHNEDQKNIPILGENPFNNNLSKKIEEIRNINKIKYENCNFSGNVTFDCSNNNGCYKLGVGEYEFNTKWSIANNNIVYAYGYVGYLKGCNDFPNYKEIINFDFSSNTRRIESREIVIFKNSYGKFLAVKVMEALSKSHGKDRDEISFEYIIYDDFD